MSRTMASSQRVAGEVTTQATAAARDRRAGSRYDAEARRSLLALASIFGVMLVTPFLVNQFYLGIVLLGAIYAVAILGLHFIVGLTGQLSLAQGSFFGIGAYVAAVLSTQHGWTFWTTVPAAAAVGIAVGIGLGIPTLRLTGHYLALATIGFTIIVHILLLNWRTVTGGADGIGGIPAPVLGNYVLSQDFYYYYLVLALLAPLALAAWKIKESRIGRAFLAIREDELAASASGIDTMRYKILAFTLSTTFGAVGGALYAHGLGRYISPDVFVFELSVAMLVMLLLGGQATVPGAVLGALIISALPDALRFLDRWYVAVYGILVIVLVIFLPDGLWGRLNALLQARRRRKDEQRPTGAAAPDMEGVSFDDR